MRGRLVPGAGQGRPGWRRWVEFAALWSVCFAVTAGLAAWEAARLADARGTVASGWAGGIVAGVGLGLGLEALVGVPVLIHLRRRRPLPSAVAKTILIIFIPLIVVLVFAAIFASAPPRNPGPVPYVTTSGIGVAEIAYACSFLAQFAVGVIAWLVAALRQRRPLAD